MALETIGESPEVSGRIRAAPHEFCTAAIVIVFTQCFDALEYSGADLAPLFRIITFFGRTIAFAIMFRYFIARPLGIWTLIRSNPVPWLFVAFASASWLWSDLPGVTAYRLLGLTTLVGFAAYFSENYSIRTQIYFMLGALALGAILSGPFVLAFPKLGVSFASQGGGVEEAQGWKGLYFHKNTMGSRMNQMAVLALTMLLSGEIPLISAALILLAGILIAKSNSSTSLVIFGMIVSTTLLFSIFFRAGKRLKWLLLSALSFGAVAFLVWVFSNFDLITAMLGRNSSLTGRMPLWDQCLKQFSSRPWLGFGYASFWPLGEEIKFYPGAEEMYRTIYWEPGTAHNAFLELAMGLGLIGLTIFVIDLVRVTRLALLFFTEEGANSDPFYIRAGPILTIIFLILNSLLESTLAARWNFATFTYFVLSFGLPKLVGHRRTRLRLAREGAQ